MTEHGSGSTRTSRRRLLIGFAGIGVGGLAGCSGSSDDPSSGDGTGSPTGSDGDSLADVTPDPPTGTVANAPIPEDPSSFTYAKTGTGDATVTATYYGNWKCPHCATFSTGLLGDFVTDYVEPGDLAIKYRALAYAGGEPFMGPDAPNVARAGLAVWHADPESYWPFHEYVMANQPSSRTEWATPDRLARMAKIAGVSDVDAVHTAASGEEGGGYQEPVEQTSSAAAQAGVEGTPSVQIGDTVANPLGNEEEVRQAIEDAIAGASSTTDRRTSTTGE